MAKGDIAKFIEDFVINILSPSIGGGKVVGFDTDNLLKACLAYKRSGHVPWGLLACSGLLFGLYILTPFDQGTSNYADTSSMHRCSNARVSGTVRMMPIGARLTALTPPNAVTSKNFSHKALCMSAGISAFTVVLSNDWRSRSTRARATEPFALWLGSYAASLAPLALAPTLN
jgi:hypothetical protein